MHEKEINLIDVSFIFLRKLASRECVLRGPKMLKIDYSGGWGGRGAVPCPWLYGPGFLVEMESISYLSNRLLGCSFD